MIFIQQLITVVGIGKKKIYISDTVYIFSTEVPFLDYASLNEWRGRCSRYMFYFNYENNLEYHNLSSSKRYFLY